MIYRWIHLSDIHFLDSNYNTKIMRRKLIEFLQSESFHNVEYIFFSGDISNKGEIEEKTTRLYIDKICESLKVKYDNVFITPGNHDIKRSKERKEVLKKIYESKSSFDELNNIDTNDENILINSQREYIDFVSELFGKHISPDKIHRCIINENIIVLNINSSWASIENNENLVFGHQHLDCIEKLNNSDNRLKVAISHYPLEWFSQIQQNRLIDFLQRNRFDIYLSGHTHTSDVYKKDSITFCNCRRLSAERSSVDELNPGFSIGQVNTENQKESFIKFYTWVNSQGKWDLDNGVKSTVYGGYYELKLDKYPNSISKKIYLKNVLIKCPMTTYTAIEEIITNFNLDPEICEIDNEGFKDWDSEKRNNFSHLESMNNNIKTIFSIAPIPSLIHLGYLLQDSSQIKIWQYDDMQTKKWVCDEENKEFSLIIQTKQRKKSELILNISITHLIDDNQIIQCLGKLKNFDLIHFEAKPSPQKCICLYNNQVIEAKTKIKQFLFNTISLSKYSKVHLFYAGPAGLAIEVGRIIQNNMWPPVYIYNFNQQYSLALTLNDKSP